MITPGRLCQSKQVQSLVVWVTIRMANIGKEDAEVGYWIGRPYWNQGYCTEALYAMIGYCFNVKRFQTLWADYFIDNPASGRVMDKCGFTDTGKKNYCSRLLHGDDKPICVMRLDYSAYRP